MRQPTEVIAMSRFIFRLLMVLNLQILGRLGWRGTTAAKPPDKAPLPKGEGEMWDCVRVGVGGHKCTDSVSGRVFYCTNDFSTCEEEIG